MQVASSTLYGPVNLTVIEVGQGEDAWVFIPFEGDTATVRVLDERHVFAYTGQGDWAIFNSETQRRIAEATDRPTLSFRDRMVLPHIFCFSPEQRALFLAGKQFPTSRYNRVYEIPVNGKPVRVHELSDDAHIERLALRNDGAIIGVSSGGLEGVLRTILHPRNGEVQTDRLDDAPYWAAMSDYGPRWISPDGRWALRNALGPLLPAPCRRAGVVERFMPRKLAAPSHPDLVPDGEPRYPLVLELIELEPLRQAAALVVAYRTAKELGLYPGDVRSLDGWFQRPASHRPTLLSSTYAESTNAERAEIDRIAKTNILNRLDDVVWDADSTGFSLRVGEYQVHLDSNNIGFYRQWRRRVALDGTIGELELVESKSLETKLPNVSEQALASARASMKQRSTQVVPLQGTSVADLLAAIEEMTRRISASALSDITFAGVLRFRFRFGRKLLNEKKLFELVRAAPIDEAKPAVETTRELLLSYGEAARRHATERPGETLRSGDDDVAPAALSEAALTLASLDDESAAALRGWFKSVDQEHDSFAAEKVFPAYAERTRFRTVGALRFGIWFFLHQWQTVSFDRSWLGLFDIARGTVEPELFARLACEEARSLSEGVASTDIADRLSDHVERLIEQLGSSDWGRAVTERLRRLADVG